MAKNTESQQPREVSPEELEASSTVTNTAIPATATEQPGTNVKEASATKPGQRSRRRLIIGGSIAAGVAALALSFGGGYALGNLGDGNGPGHDDWANGQSFDGGQGAANGQLDQGGGRGGHGHGDSDGDHGGPSFQGGAVPNGQTMPAPPGGQAQQLPALPGAPGQQAPATPGTAPATP